MRLIGLHGRRSAGKDTVGDILCRQHGFDRLSFAGPLKDGLIAMFSLRRADFDGEAKERPVDPIGISPRRLMQTLGTEWGRKILREDVWVLLADASVQRMRLFTQRIVITDVRYENEADWVRRLGGAVWHIHRPVAGENVIDLRSRGHSSDGTLPIVVGTDSVIDNSAGLEQLADQVKQALAGEHVVTGYPVQEA